MLNVELRMLSCSRYAAMKNGLNYELRMLSYELWVTNVGCWNKKSRKRGCFLLYCLLL